MNYLKYLQQNNYKKGIDNCWTFVQEIFKDEHNYQLPDVPIFDDPREWKSYIKANAKYEIHGKAHKGCLIHVWTPKDEHIGYAIDEKQYIHKTQNGVFISTIPKRCIIYEVIY